MGRTERRFWDFVIRNRLKVLIACMTLLSMYARFAFRGFISGDMWIFLIPWYDAIKKMGGLKALSVQVGNYQISYQTLIALMTYIPIQKEYAYKILSILFDYAMGIAAAAVVREITGSKTKAAASYAVVVMLPITVLNSAAWGQCDSIYTFFLMMTFLMLLREKPIGAMLLFGLALSFKLQAVFFLPFLLFYYVWSKKFSAWYFLLIPVPLLLFRICGVVQGRSLWDIIQVYVKQGAEYPRISSNYPSFWNLMVVTKAEYGTDYYDELHVLCLMTTIAVLGGIMFWMIRRKELRRETLMIAATLMMYTCVLFLPAMHERYSYPALIFAVAACAIHPWMIPPALGILLIDLQTYSAYLMEKSVMSWEFLVLLNIACYAAVVWQMLRSGEVKSSS